MIDYTFLDIVEQDPKIVELLIKAGISKEEYTKAYNDKRKRINMIAEAIDGKSIKIELPTRVEASQKILNEIFGEVQRQHKINNADNDHLNSPNDWVAYITSYVGRAANTYRNVREDCQFKDNLIKAAALIVSALVVDETSIKVVGPTITLE